VDGMCAMCDVTLHQTQSRMSAPFRIWQHPSYYRATKSWRRNYVVLSDTNKWPFLTKVGHIGNFNVPFSCSDLMEYIFHDTLMWLFVSQLHSCNTTRNT